MIPRDYLILHEEDVSELISVELATKAIEECFEEKAEGKFQAMPKQLITGQHGSLVITPGESQSRSQVIGFRCYDVIRDVYDKQEQFTVVYDNYSGQLKGVVFSQMLGAYRTAAINAVMQKKLKKSEIKQLSIIGTGFQANIHFDFFVESLEPQSVLVYGRSPDKVWDFIARKKKRYDMPIKQAESIEEAVKNADSILCATRSREALFTEAQLEHGVTITTIGPKIKGASELPSSLLGSCEACFSDSIEQVHKYGERFFAEDISVVHDFSDILSGKHRGRQWDNEKIVLCSVGMGGTEVVLASKLLDKKKEMLERATNGRA